MIPKENRLRTKADFDNLFKKGRVYHSSGVSIKIVPNKKDITRFGFTISTKVSKRAVKRNKVRRRLRSIVGKVLSDIKVGYDVAFLTRKDVLEMTYKEIEKSTLQALKKSGLLADNINETK